MHENLKDILKEMPPHIDEQTLLLYLQGTLPPEKQNEVEKYLIDNPFAADAVEGLQSFQNKASLPGITEQLNKELRKKTAAPKRRSSIRVQAEPWLIIALVLILLLVIISYVVIYKYLSR